MATFDNRQDSLNINDNPRLPNEPPLLPSSSYQPVAPVTNSSLTIGTGTSYGGVSNIYERPLNPRVVGVYNGRPVYDTGMKTGSDIGSGTPNHIHFEDNAWFQKGRSIGLTEMTERFTALALAYDQMGYKLRDPNFGNYFDPNASLEDRKRWVQNAINKHTHSGPKQAIDYWVVSKNNPGTDSTGVAGVPILVALGTDGGQVIPNHGNSFNEGGGGYYAQVISPDGKMTVTMHGDRKGGPAQPGTVHSGGVDLQRLDQSKILESIMNGELRPPNLNETYFNLASQRLNWLKRQFPEQLGDLPDVSLSSTLDSTVVKQLQQWRDRLGLDRVGADKVLGPDLLVAMNGLISQTNHGKADEFAASIPPNGWSIVAEVEQRLGLQSTDSQIATSEVPPEDSNQAEYSLITSGLKEGYQEKLEGIANGSESPVGWGTPLNGLDIQSFRESLVSIAQKHNTKLSIPSDYLEGQSDMFTLTDRVLLKEIQKVLNVPETGILDATTASGILSQFSK